MFRSLNRRARFKDLTYGLYPKLFKLAIARLGNDEDAEDVVQEAYARAFKAFDSLQNSSNVGPWLVQILFNVIKDHVRRVARQPTVIPIEDIPEGHSATVEEEADPEHKLTESELSPYLLEALQALPDVFVYPLLLREIYGASYQEIAAILNMPIGTVMSRLARARVLLRTQLTQGSDLKQDNSQAIDHGERDTPGGKFI